MSYSTASNRYAKMANFHEDAHPQKVANFELAPPLLSALAQPPHGKSEQSTFILPDAGFVAMA